MHSYLQPVHLFHCLSYLRHNTHFCKIRKKEQASVIYLNIAQKISKYQHFQLDENKKAFFLATVHASFSTELQVTDKKHSPFPTYSFDSCPHL